MRRRDCFYGLPELRSDGLNECGFLDMNSQGVPSWVRKLIEDSGLSVGPDDRAEGCPYYSSAERFDAA